ncbi:MAG: hypothetical protein U0Q15_08395 [Kineosporiaceae bacterium]
MSRGRTAWITALTLTAAAAVVLPAAASSGTTTPTPTASGTPAPPTAPPTTSPTTSLGTPCPTYSIPMRMFPGSVARTEDFETIAGLWTQPAVGDRPVVDGAAARTGPLGLAIADLGPGPVSEPLNGWWNATGTFEVRVYARLAPGTPDTAVQLRVLDATTGAQLARTRQVLTADSWTAISRRYSPGWTHLTATCNGRVVQSWDRANPVTVELSAARKKVSRPLGVHLDDLSVTFVKQAKSTVTTTTPAR